ncbi:MAG: aspartate kinase [Piscirickettsiaceae bacterium]|nr:aspartate kinase [Piscirickettsiaceae bacterium]
MSLIVQKYGGTSVGTIKRIKRVAKQLAAHKKKGHDLIVIVSAMNGETNRLLDLANEINEHPQGRELDVLISTGEQVTIALLSLALEQLDIHATSYTGSQVRILTDRTHNKARIIKIDNVKINEDLAQGKIVVVAGFQGCDEYGNITTLGRGGSDTTAVALAASFKADECQIYTDVDGVYTTDPRVVHEARRLSKLTFEEMLEMASLGAKVLQIRSVEFASKYNIPLRVLSSFKQGGGTIIMDENSKMEQAHISGIAFSRDEAKLTISGVPDHPGIALQILGPIASDNIEVDMIIQNTGHNLTTDFTFTIHRNNYDNAFKILKNTADHLGAQKVSGNNRIAKISVVGVGMRSHAGVASTMFGALARQDINISMISTSEIKISVVVNEEYLEAGVRALHKAFNLDREFYQNNNSII